jgi:hypothetical protein
MGTLNGFLDIFESKILPERKLSKSTQTFYRQRLAVIRKHFGSLDIPEIGVLCVSSFLIEQPACISNQYRQLLGNISQPRKSKAKNVLKRLLRDTCEIPTLSSKCNGFSPANPSASQ